MPGGVYLAAFSARRYKFSLSTVAVAQLVESQIVILVVVGSSPISHPNHFPHASWPAQPASGSAFIVIPR